MMLDRLVLREIVACALREDLGSGDVTTNALFGPTQTARAIIRTKEPGVLAGLPVAEGVFKTLDEQILFEPRACEGDQLAARSEIAEIRGPLRAILTGERTALNFLQRMSGIATLTARFVAAVRDFPVQILDTRKTAPGLRLLDKYAVRLGGGRNHRWGLYDGVMIKSNHVRALGGITEAVERARSAAPATLKIEVEVNNLAEFEKALHAGADIIMLDNMPLEEMQQAVARVRNSSPKRGGEIWAHGRAPLLEASGGVTLENIREMAATGVDFISIGALTHSPQAIDMHLEVFSL